MSSSSGVTASHPTRLPRVTVARSRPAPRSYSSKILSPGRRSRMPTTSSSMPLTRRLSSLVIRSPVRSPALPAGPFRGVPFLVKDGVCHTAGDPFHCGMQVLKDLDWHEDTDTWLAERFRAAGFVFVGHGGQKLFGWFAGGGIDGTTIPVGLCTWSGGSVCHSGSKSTRSNGNSSCSSRNPAAARRSSIREHSSNDTSS